MINKIIIMLLIATPLLSQDVMIRLQPKKKIVASGGGGGGSGTVYDTVDADGRNAWSTPYYDIIYCGASDDPLWFGRYSTPSRDEQSGWQFKIEAPQGSTIDSAFLSVYPLTNNIYEDANDTVYIYCYAVDNATAWTNAAAGTLRSFASYTSAVVKWAASNFTQTNAWARSPNLKTIIQEVVNRPGYTSSSYVAVIFDVNSAWGTDKEASVNCYAQSTTLAGNIKVVYHYH